MSELTEKARKELPPKDFAEPDKRAYPIEDKAHARNAKARASEYASPALKATLGWLTCMAWKPRL